MNRFKNQILLAVGFAVLAGLISGITAAPLIAQAVKAALIKNADEPGRVPYQRTFYSTSIVPPVPAGKRLVIEHISGRIVLTGTGDLEHYSLASPNSIIYVRPELGSSTPSSKAYIVNSFIRLYVDPSASIAEGSNIIGTGTLSENMTITGYLVDLSI